MKDLIFNYLEDRETLEKLIYWLIFHLFNAEHDGEKATRNHIEELNSLQSQPEKFKMSKFCRYVRKVLTQVRTGRDLCQI